MIMQQRSCLYLLHILLTRKSNLSKTELLLLMSDIMMEMTMMKAAEEKLPGREQKSSVESAQSVQQFTPGSGRWGTSGLVTDYSPAKSLMTWLCLQEPRLSRSVRGAQGVPHGITPGTSARCQQTLATRMLSWS